MIEQGIHCCGQFWKGIPDFGGNIRRSIIAYDAPSKPKPSKGQTKLVHQRSKIPQTRRYPALILFVPARNRRRLLPKSPTNHQETYALSDNEIPYASGSIAPTEPLTSQNEGPQSVLPDSIASSNTEDDLWGVDTGSLLPEQTASEAINADDDLFHDEPNPALSDHDTLSTTFASPFHHARSPSSVWDISEDESDAEQDINLNLPESVQSTPRGTDAAIAGPTLDGLTTHLEIPVKDAPNPGDILPFGILPSRFI